ncbi:TPA: hypothetical protein ACH3X1_016443 [Trebouxia sp. C0004]
MQANSVADTQRTAGQGSPQGDGGVAQTRSRDLPARFRLDTRLPARQPAETSNSSGDDRSRGSAELKMRSDVVGAMKKIMTMHTFFPSSTHYDLVALSVMGKPDLEQAKDDYPNYLDITRRAETDARNFRADTAKRVTEEAYEQWK